MRLSPKDKDSISAVLISPNNIFSMEETRITLVCDNDVQRYKAFNQNPNFNIIFYKKNLIEVLWLLFLQAFIIFE